MFWKPKTQISPTKDHLSKIILSGLEGGHLGILNVYALNMVGERYVMWYEVIQSLPMDCKWIMTGDFNMVKIPLNRSMSSCSRLMGLRRSWHGHTLKANTILRFTLAEMMDLSAYGTTFGRMVPIFLLD